MEPYIAIIPVGALPEKLLDGFHSKSCLCVTRIRTFVRAIAPRLKRTSYGRQAIENAACSKRRAAEDSDALKWYPNGTSFGFRRTSTQVANKMGSRMIAIADKVQGQIGGNTAHPSNRRIVNAAGTRLRRRLSRIFHR